MVAWIEKNSRLLLAVTGGVMLLAGLAWWAFFYEARYTVNPSPTSASVMVDGRSVRAGQRVKLKPGSHTLVVTLNEFVPFEQTIQARSGQYRTLPIVLKSLPHLQSVTRDRVTGVAIDPTTGAIVYVNQASGRAEQVTLIADPTPTEPVALSPAGSLTGIDEWLWGPSFDLGLFRSGSKWKLYNFNRADLLHQSVTDWPAGVGSVSWKPTGQQTANGKQQTAVSHQPSTLIHYNAPSDGEQTLVETDPLHASASRLIDLRGSGVNTPIVNWVGAGDDVVLLSKDGRLWQFVVYTRSLTAITASETVDGFLASPDGQMILAHTRDNQLFVIGIDGTTKRTLAETGSLAGATWSPDSSAVWLVTTDDGLAVRRIDIATDITTAYAVASTDSVGQLSQILVTDDEQTLVLSGSVGLTTLPLVPETYSAAE